MWFEILPSGVIIYVAFNFSTWGTYLIHRLCLGNAYRRDLREVYARRLYMRDRRICLYTNPYRLSCLENICGEPDDVDSKTGKKKTKDSSKKKCTI